MPFHGNPFTKGRLFVHFSVAFPKTLPANAVAAIKAVLPKPTVPMLSGEEEECNMTDVDLSQFGNNIPSTIHTFRFVILSFIHIPTLLTHPLMMMIIMILSCKKSHHII